MNIMLNVNKSLTLKYTSTNSAWLTKLSIKFTQDEKVILIDPHQSVLTNLMDVFTFMKINNMYAEVEHQLKLVSDGSVHTLIQ